MLLASSVPNQVLYLYDPDETTETTFSYLDYSTYYDHLFGLYMVAGLGLVAQAATAAGIKNEWLVQKELNAALMGEDGEAAEADAEEVVADEAAEEPATDFFF